MSRPRQEKIVGLKKVVWKGKAVSKERTRGKKNVKTDIQREVDHTGEGK